jgi:transcriptional regulator with XRE-family HTH domain
MAQNLAVHYTTFGSRVRFLRQCRRIKQGVLASAVGLSQSYLCDLENNADHRTPPGATVAKIADMLGTSADYLLLRTDDPEVQPELA